MSIGFYYAIHGQIKTTPLTKITIEAEIPPDFYEKNLGANDNSKTIDLHWCNYDYVSIRSAPFNPGTPNERGRLSSIASNGKVKWSLYTTKNLLLNSTYFNRAGYYANPGDSIYVRYHNDEPVFSGKGALAFEMQQKLRKLLLTQKEPPTKNRFAIETLDEYFQWMHFFDEQITFIDSFLNIYIDKIPLKQHNLIKVALISGIESSRLDRFQQLYTYSTTKGITKPISGLDSTDLNSIWDSTQSNTQWGDWVRKIPDYYDSPSYLYIFNQQAVRRKFNFDFSQESLKSKLLRVQAYYDEAKKSFSGLQRERLLIRILAEEVITELGPLHSITQIILKDYYSLPILPKFKNWIERYYEKNMALRKNKRANNFSVVDLKNKAFTKEQITNKVALLDFWYTGCKDCQQMTTALKKIQKMFKSDTNVVFISISKDKIREIWEQSIRESRYTTGMSINVYTAGEGAEHDMIKQYKIPDFPRLILIDAEGQFAVSEVPDPRREEGMNELVDLIKQESKKAANRLHTVVNDGPYVLYSDKPLTAYAIEAGNVVVSERIYNLTVQTDIPGKTFTVNIKNELPTEPCVFAQPDKLLALSDIEGNFDAFRLLLQKNGVIDDSFNWTFGTGHLVIAGDVFDRGMQVTECLWLIYSLEDKAKVAGGYVHFILGNHEIMNLSNNFRYVQNKYKVNAKSMGIDYNKLYGKGSELGKWLRTKNIMEKIGDFLFVHGGISAEVNQMTLSIDEINNLSRSHYGHSIDTSDKKLYTLFNTATSPFWYRGYYAKPTQQKRIPSMQQVENTLKKFFVSKIITGHTIVADGISTYYEGKVINIDTDHAAGISEALFIDGTDFYRTNSIGKKEKLFNIGESK